MPVKARMTVADGPDTASSHHQRPLNQRFMALTSASLPALPKLDKNQFIDAYLQAQKAHAKSYAEEGRSLSSSWDIQTTPQKPSAAVSSGSHNVGFATPILRARTPRPVNAEASKKENIPSKSANKPATRPVPSADKKKPKVNDEPDKTSKFQKSKKRAGPESEPDEDQVARLLERRERKRVKRAIVQPKEASEHDTASSNGNPKSKRTKAKGKKPKVPSGFALMHGFTATNVGKNRLTLKPPSNVGVFKKGKASFNAKIKAKPKGHKTQHFSEFGFLNNTKKATGHVTSDSSSASGSESSATSAQEIPKPKKKAVAQKSRQAIIHTVPRHSSDLSKKTASGKRPIAESEIWDIESHASEKKNLRRQKTQSVEETSVIHVPGTVLMDARMPAWSERVARAAEVDAGEIPDAIVIPSSPSLRPSQSASQVQPLIQPKRTEVASQYFPAVKQAPATHSTPQPPPPVKPVPSPDPEAVEPQLQPPPIPPISSDSNVFVPPTHFAVPPRNRVFANHFLSVRQDSNLYLSTLIPVAPQDLEDLDHYASTLDCFETFESGFCPDEFALQYSVAGEPALDDDTQLGHYVSHGGDWDDTPTPAIDGWLDNYDEEDHHHHESPVPYENAFADPEYMDAIGEEDEYLEPGYKGPSYGKCEADIFMDIVDEFGSNAGWEEATADSVYLNDSGYERIAIDYGYDALASDENGHQITEDAYDDQEFIGTSVRDDPGDITSECSDPASAYNARFTQGRALLLGLPVHDAGERISQPAPHFSTAEVDVVKALRGHWLPQRL
ncbi:hypothetical protein C8F04DRAFT_1058841 [Mycena alexandri]|uniref:Uncharacterized protein n=1 Tax=Mycena alexandri TaxID=1745969 RepID=A0AAD6TK39_9AGAR|nr:hypothetical protein C8F04DRAFT_1058841 [Mycena alexandri]